MPTIPEPPTKPAVTLGIEGGGHTVTCECGWLRWFAAKSDAAESGQAHASKCKGPRETKTQAAPKRAASDWSGREGATWIDKL